MRLILLSSLLLLGTLLANGHLSDSEEQMVSSIIEAMMILQKKFANLQYAFLSVHNARSFASGSKRIYVTNKEFKKFVDVRDTCDQAGGHMPSPSCQNENKAFTNVLDKHSKEAYLVVGDSANFTNWAEGQPNAADGACVKADTHGAWHSASCDEDLLVVCEFSFSL